MARHTSFAAGPSGATTSDTAFRSSVASPEVLLTPRAAMRPARKAREGHIPGVCTDEQRRAPGMQRRPNVTNFGDATLAPECTGCSCKMGLSSLATPTEANRGVVPECT